MTRIELWLTSHLANLRTFAIAGTLLLAATQPVIARNDFTFRDFREQNPDMARRDARQAFRVENRGLRQADAERFRQGPILHITPVTQVETVNIPTESRVRHHDNLNLLRNRSAQVGDSGKLLRHKSGLDLDLTSSQRNISLGKGLFANTDSIQINSGGESKTVHAGDLVSAAEFVAVKQVLSSGEQKVIVDRSGRASGGDVNLELLATDRTTLRASNLVISEGVTTSGDFGRNSDFKLLGDLSNYGTLQAFSSDSGKRAGTIRANDINNYKGATIESTVDLTLDAAGNLNNAGTISSTASLTLSAAGSINNKGITSAVGDVTLQSAAINNKGTIESTGGNVNLEGSSLALMNVDNNKGTIKALNGAINVRNSAYTGAFDSYVDGGDLLSKTLNINTGYGTSNVYVNELTGVINQYGKAAHIAASTDSLTLGTTCLTGDPTIYNSAGDINVTADISVAENLVLVATGDIIVADNVDIFAGNATRGFEMNFIAGAAFVPTGGGSNSPTIPPLTGAGGVDLSGKASKTGGGIIMGNNVTVTSRASSLAGNTNGDGILMVAFQGKTPNAGKVDISGATIKTGGSGTGTNGSVFVLAAGTKGDVIKAGVIDATGGSSDSNGEGQIGLYTVDITTQQKVFNNSQPQTGNVVYDANGVNTSNYFLTGNDLSKGGNLVINDATAGVDIKGRRISLYGGGGVSILGQVDSLSADPGTLSTSIDMVTNGSITSGANGSLKALGVIFLIATNASSTIGTVAAPIVTDAKDVEFFNNKGKDVYVKIIGTGDVDITGLASSRGTISVDATNREVSSPFNLLSAGTINIVADSLGELENVDAGVLNVTLKNGDFTKGNFNNVSAQVVGLIASNGGIGSDGFPVSAPTGAKQISLTAGGGRILMSNFSGKALEVTSAFAKDDVTVFSNASLIVGPTFVSETGSVSLQAAGVSTLTVSGDITGKDGVTLTASNEKGKIVIAKNTTISTDGTAGGDGDITIQVGAGSAVPVVPPPANIVVNKTGTGDATITGGGVKAKAPVNTLNILGSANILITNGATSSNLTMGGGVVITADNNN
jgi:fibronectin-binding autotransporter adhesin